MGKHYSNRQKARARVRDNHARGHHMGYLGDAGLLCTRACAYVGAHRAQD